MKNENEQIFETPKTAKKYKLNILYALLFIILIIVILFLIYIFFVKENSNRTDFFNKSKEIYDELKLKEFSEQKTYKIENHKFIGDSLDIEGKLPKEGLIIVEGKKISMILRDEKYCLIKSIDEDEMQFKNLSDCKVLLNKQKEIVVPSNDGIKDKYIVTFKFDNGSKDLTKEVVSGKPIENIDTPLKKGYKFLGWFIEDKKFDITTSILKNTTLLAKWEIEDSSEKTIKENINPTPTTPSTPISSDNNPNSCFTYEENLGTLTITGYRNDCPKSITIPSKIESKIVTKIGKDAFFKKDLISVVIPSTVKQIDWGAFYSNKISSLTLNEGLESIMHSAFKNNQISSLKIPNSLKRIENGAFQNNMLTSLVIPENLSLGWDTFSKNRITNLNISPNAIITAAAFNDNLLPDSAAFIYKQLGNGKVDKTTIVSYGGANRENIVIPYGVKTLEKESFYQLNINKIKLPSSLEKIESYAFSHSNLNAIEIPSSVNYIGHGAFYDNQLTNITIPSNATYVGSHAFNNNQLPDSKAFIYKRNSDGSEDKTILISYGGAKRNNIIIPNTVKILEKSSFAYHNGNGDITEIVIPSNVTEIRENVFYSTGLKKIVIKNSKTNITIHNNAFWTSNVNIAYEP